MSTLPAKLLKKNCSAEMLQSILKPRKKSCAVEASQLSLIQLPAEKLQQIRDVMRDISMPKSIV